MQEIDQNDKSNKDGGVDLTMTLCQMVFVSPNSRKEERCVLFSRQDLGNTAIEFLIKERKATAIPDMTYQDSLVVSTAVSHSLAIFGLLEQHFWTQASLLCFCESVKKINRSDGYANNIICVSCLTQHDFNI